MVKTLIMSGLVCLLATITIIDFIVVIPRFGAKYFGAPDDIREMMSNIPDRAVWVSILGICIMMAGFAGVIAVLIWAAVDIVKSDMSFKGAFIRFLIITEGYKLFDIICVDYLMLTKLKLPVKIYPETAWAKVHPDSAYTLISMGLCGSRKIKSCRGRLWLLSAD